VSVVERLISRVRSAGSVIGSVSAVGFMDPPVLATNSWLKMFYQKSQFMWKKHNFNISILWSIFILVLCLKHITFSEITQIHKIYYLWNEKERNKRLNTIHSIKITPSWLFPHAKYKSISPFSIDISWIMWTYPHKA